MTDFDEDDTQEKRTLLLEIFKREALPNFPTYFEKLFEKKEEKRNFNSPWMDCFQPVAVPDGNGGFSGTVSCVLPAPRYYWDAWFSVYLLENPDIFYSPSLIAKNILQEIENLKLDPSGFVNFEPFHEEYLIRMLNGKTQNKFMDDPFGCVLAMKLCPWVETMRGQQDPVDFVQNSPEFQKEILKLEEEMKKDWKQKYPKFLIK